MLELVEQLIAIPRLIEVDSVEVDVASERSWHAVRHPGAQSLPLIETLFELGELRARPIEPAPTATSGSLADLVANPKHPGFSLVVEKPGHELVVGAIGKFWQSEIDCLPMSDAAAFEQFAEAGWGKLAWVIRVEALGEQRSKITIEVWATATDDETWKRFRRYLAQVGPGAHFIRRSILMRWQKELGKVEGDEEALTLPGDALLSDTQAQVTHSIEIRARPEQIWPWLAQMGAGRAGFYSHDLLAPSGPSARQLHPEWQNLEPGQVIGLKVDAPEAFEVLSVEPPNQLVLGGLYDTKQDRQLAFNAQRPTDFWHVTWAFVLQPMATERTRLTVRARAAFSRGQRWQALAIRPVHQLMQAEMLRQLADRAEGKFSPDGWRDVIAGLGGALVIALGVATPFLRPQRRHWGISRLLAERVHPGDNVVAEPQWSWTHGVTIEAPAASVWPWVAQIGANRGGFYSYQWLENLAGCKLTNAEAVHPEWELNLGDTLLLHPEAPALHITELDRGHYFVASSDEPATSNAPDASGKQMQARPWVRFSWLFWVEPLTDTRCRLISRARYACSDELLTRLFNGPLLLEPVGFAMDRKMLLTIKGRCEHSLVAA